MPRFFNHRENLQAIGDIAVAGVHGFKNSAVGTVVLATTGIAFVGPLTTVAAACALGAALTIIPALYLYGEYFNMSKSNPYTVKAGVETLFKAAFAFGSACLGAAILGYALAPIGLTALTGSLTFSLLKVITNLIVDATASDCSNNKLAVSIT